MPELSITVLHYNRWDLTRDCLASIDTQEIPCSYEKVLVDNGSTTILPTLPEDWRLVRYDTNKNQIQGQNRCFESAQGEWVLFVANDVRLNPTCIEWLWITASRSEVPVGQAQPQVFTAPRIGIDQVGMDWKWPGYGISRKTIGNCLPPIVPSTCYIMKRATWKTMGGFDESLQSSHEDVDMGIRLQRARYRNVLNPNASVLHLGNATLKHQPSHTRAAFHRDRVYVIKKYYRGIDRLTRLVAVNLLDSFPRF